MPALPLRRHLPEWCLVGLIVIVAIAHHCIYRSCISDNIHRYGLSNHSAIFHDDSSSYYDLGEELAHSHSYHSLVRSPDSQAFFSLAEIRTPAYPTLLALIYALSRDGNPISPGNLNLVFACQALILALSAIPIYCSIRQLIPNNRRFAIAGAVAAIIGTTSVWISGRILTESLAFFEMSLLVYILTRALLDDRPGWYWLTGLVLALLSMTRPSLSFLWIPIGLGLLIHARMSQERRITQLAYPLLVLVLLPSASKVVWAVRNQVVEGRYSYCQLSTFGIYTYSAALPVDISLGRSSQDATTHYYREFFDLLPKLSSNALDRYYERKTFALVEAYPLPIVRSFLKGTILFFSPSWPALPFLKDRPLHTRDLVKPGFWIHPTLERLYFAYFTAHFLLECVLLPLAALVLLASITIPSYRRIVRASRHLLVFELVIAYCIITHANTSVFDNPARFRFPCMPFLIVTTVVAFQRIIASRQLSYVYTHFREKERSELAEERMPTAQQVATHPSDAH